VAAEKGRGVILHWGGSPILGVREKGLKLDGNAINVTSDEDNGWQTLLTVSDENKVEVSVSGVAKDNRLKTDWFAGDRTKPLSMEWADAKELAGTFFLASYSEKQGYKDAVTFDATFTSHGTPTFTSYS
jgi:predicted secreted protein